MPEVWHVLVATCHIFITCWHPILNSHLVTKHHIDKIFNFLVWWHARVSRSDSTRRHWSGNFMLQKLCKLFPLLSPTLIYCIEELCLHSQLRNCLARLCRWRHSCESFSSQYPGRCLTSHRKLGYRPNIHKERILVCALIILIFLSFYTIFNSYWAVQLHELLFELYPDFRLFDIIIASIAIIPFLHTFFSF